MSNSAPTVIDTLTESFVSHLDSELLVVVTEKISFCSLGKGFLKVEDFTTFGYVVNFYDAKS